MVVLSGGGLLGDDAVALRRHDDGWFVHPCATTLRLADLPVEAAWRLGPKREAHVLSATKPAKLGRLVVLDHEASPALGAQRGVGLFRALLTLQAGWVWGDTRTRRSVVEATVALCDCIERGNL